MRRFGGLRRALPTTHRTFLCGAAALAGVPLLSGFWSKDAIFASLYTASHMSEHGAYYGWILGIAALTAFLTAFYTFRAYFLTFWGAERFPPEAHRALVAKVSSGELKNVARAPAAEWPCSSAWW